MLAGVSLDADPPSSARFSTKFSNHSGRSCNRFPSIRLMPLFSSFDCSELRNSSPNSPLRAPRRRIVAGLDVESSVVESCDTDVGDVLVVKLEEPVDKSGTTIGT